MNNYKLQLTALSPIHIGTGEAYEPTSFVVDENYLYEFDEVLFYKSLNEIDKKALNTKVNNWIQIVDFYKTKADEAKKIYKNRTKVTNKVQDSYKKINNKDGTRNKNQFLINKTFKNPNTFRAIIPGSSIKGMLITALKIHPGVIKDNTKRQKLIVSDAILVKGGTEIGYSYRVHKNPTKNSRSKIPQIAEVILPGSIFVFSIKTTMDLSIIEKHINNFVEKRSQKIGEKKEKGFIARIGKYSGKDYMVDDLKNAKNHYNKSIATHTVYEDNNAPFGWIKLEAISDESFNDSLSDIKTIEKNYLKEVKERQKDILQKIEEEKKEELEKAYRLKQKKLQEEEEARRAEELEKERVVKLTPLEKAIELLPNPSGMLQTTLIIKAIEDGLLSEFRDQALDFVIALMKKNNDWRETSKSKNPKKDRRHQATLKVMKMKGK